jgi:hypothetical protein
MLRQHSPHVKHYQLLRALHSTYSIAHFVTATPALLPITKKRDTEQMSPEQWGPVVWRLLHALADASHRRDVILLWASVIRQLAAVLPCQKCREHMRAYWSAHVFIPKGWERMTLPQLQTLLRRRLHDFHNDVNIRLGKPIMAAEQPLRSHAEAMSAVQEAWGTLKGMWDSLAPTVAAYFEWRTDMTRLIQLVAAGIEEHKEVPRKGR